MTRRPLFTQRGTQEPPDHPPAELASGSAGPPMRPEYRTPVITYSLIAANVAMWLLVAAVGPGGWLQQLISPDPGALLLLGAKYGPAIQAGQYWRLVTAIFLHAGMLHLAVNMWALFQLGTLCEVLYGRQRFLILYVCSGVLGTFASYELSPQLGVGASGAIFGLMGVALVYSIKYRRELPRGMGDRLRRSLMPWVILNLMLTFTIRVIDAAAHVGGFVSGMVLAGVAESQHAPVERRQSEALPATLALLTAIGLLVYGAWGLASVLPAAAEYRAATTLLAQRRWSQATQEFLAASRRPLPPEVILPVGLAIAGRLGEEHQGPVAEAVYRRLLELAPNDPEVLNGLAYLYADVLETNLAEAERRARKALEKLPNSGEILDTLAWVYYKEGKLADALGTQRQAVRFAGNSAVIHYHLGAIEEKLGSLATARQEYEAALRLDPKFAPAALALKRLQGHKPPAPPPSSR